MKNPTPPAPPARSALPTYLVPCGVVALAALYIGFVSALPADSDKKMNFSEFGQIPVVENGRVKPLDTVARTKVMLISHRQYYTTTDKAKNTTSHPAVEWVLESMANGLANYARSIPVMVEKDVAAWLGLPPRDDNEYTGMEISKAARARDKELNALLTRARNQPTELDTRIIRILMEAEKRNRAQEQIQDNLVRNSVWDVKIFRIENDQVLRMLGLDRVEGLRYSLADLREHDGLEKLKEAAGQAIRRDEKTRNEYDVAVLDLHKNVQTAGELFAMQGMLMVPVDVANDKWMSLGDALTSGEASPNAQALQGILLAYASGDAKAFNSEVKSYRASLASTLPVEQARAHTEVWFNNFAPFYHCAILYALVMVLAPLSWLCFRGPLRWSAFGVTVLALLVHTAAIGLRMYIHGRPPVTNLYSSAVFIGWACVLLCLVMERVYRNGVCLAVAGFTGFPALVVAHHLAGSGDTLEMMVAVLDTNFWLSTHVVCVTLGYAATFIAGFLGIAYILTGVISSLLDSGKLGYHLLDRELAKTLGQMMYGVVCFATLLSFVGTVLGGIWADQSWGRFWGWDPKENGAVLIVIMNALVLHARWGGLVKERGMAMLVVVGNMITAWSWFGTNQLSVGLHNYGFNSQLAMGCTAFWFLHLGFLALAMSPFAAWQKGYFDSVRTAGPAPMPEMPRPGPAGSAAIMPGR